MNMVQIDYLDSENMEVDSYESETPQQQLISGRAIEEIDGILVAAKLDRDELQSVSQEILFGPDFSTKEFRLLQLDKDVLESVQTGQVLVFRGDEHDSAVLCTNKATYEIKEAETSNSLLLFQDLTLPDPAMSLNGSTSSKSPGSSANSSLNSSNTKDDSVVEVDGGEKTNFLTVESRMIVDVAHSYLEMKKIRPNLSKIRFILRGGEYDGTEKSDRGSIVQSEGNLITLSNLLDKVPASKQEILDYVDENRILENNGKLRLVDDDYLFQIFSQVLNCIDENGWSANEIDKDVVIQTLSTLAKPFFLEKIFLWFFEPAVGEGSSTSRFNYTFAESKVCAFLGEVLLKTMGRFNLKEFMKVWQESVPEGLKVNLCQLKGIAVYDEDASPPVIWHFPEYNLPESFTERLSLLFETKERWKLEEISPFIEVFSPPSQNVGNLLTKYARSTTVNGVKYYFTKHRR